MRIENEEIYPNCQIITRTVEVGGLTKSQLIQKLKQYSILMNESGERLLADDKFTTSDTKYSLQTVELTVGDLGFPDGATTAQIFKRASELGQVVTCLFYFNLGEGTILSFSHII